MNISSHAGKPADPSMLINVARLVTAYYTEQPDPAIASQRVSFGTSGHRGSAFEVSFNEAHILAITQAICIYRKSHGISGPLFLGIDTHALSEPAFASALEVLAANGVEVMLDEHRGYTPTPVISHAILTFNRGRKSGLADGIVITPSHNPPQDGGFKYNPPHGGPADVDTTDWIEKQANSFLAEKLQGVKRMLFTHALKASTTKRHDYIGSYVSDLKNVADLEVVREAGLRVGVDPLGGAGVHYWGPVSERYRLPLTIVNEGVDPTFRFMTVDWDGQIRMDCSSPYAMAGLVGMRERFDIAFATDTDNDRHGIVTRGGGLMNPNHYLAAAISYLFSQRTGWPKAAAVGKTIVSSSIIDRITARLGRKLVEVPVGFKWFVEGLMGGSLGFGGEESAGASFLRADGSVWTTDKDGILLCLLAAEMTARTGKDPAELYRDITRDFGASAYERIDAPLEPEQRAPLVNILERELRLETLAGEKIQKILTKAPGNESPIGGIKVVTENGWFAVRPSGTEPVYKLYAESFRGVDHLRQIQSEAQALVAAILKGGPAATRT
jgi:phosphoglucomutase